MSERAIRIEFRVRMDGGETYCGGELAIVDPEAIRGIVHRAAGRPDAAGWALVRQYLAMAAEQTLLEWAQRELEPLIRQESTPAEVLACALANHRRRIDSTGGPG